MSYPDLRSTQAAPALSGMLSLVSGEMAFAGVGMDAGQPRLAMSGGALTSGRSQSLPCPAQSFPSPSPPPMFASSLVQSAVRRAMIMVKSASLTHYAGSNVPTSMVPTLRHAAHKLSTLSPSHSFTRTATDIVMAALQNQDATPPPKSSDNPATSTPKKRTSVLALISDILLQMTEHQMQSPGPTASPATGITPGKPSTPSSDDSCHPSHGSYNNPNHNDESTNCVLLPAEDDPSGISGPARSIYMASSADQRCQQLEAELASLRLQNSVLHSRLEAAELSESMAVASVTQAMEQRLAQSQRAASAELAASCLDASLEVLDQEIWVLEAQKEEALAEAERLQKIAALEAAEHDHTRHVLAQLLAQLDQQGLLQKVLNGAGLSELMGSVMGTAAVTAESLAARLDVVGLTCNDQGQMGMSVGVEDSGMVQVN